MKGFTIRQTAAPPGTWPPSPMAGRNHQGRLLGPGAGRHAATAVVWNPVRQLFVAAVRYHGYYQSADGVTWTRMSAQPGTGLTALDVPHQPRGGRLHRLPHFSRRAGRESCNRRHLCVDSGPEQPGPGVVAGSMRTSGGTCGNPAIAFARQWNTAALETSTLEGAATIADGD